ncbi:unnamed protein product [Rhizoctonia solani]|uniref:Chromatin remodeling factor mit1 n=1 Tax=Rhizoctonia solani TaxID=456999 RepID=A0A8H2XJ98_9AGAM|nr:unnamed protein product [Rhizoctonia solani]
MAKSLVGSTTIDDDQAIEILDSSEEENASVSHKSPVMPSSMAGSPNAQPPPKFWIELPPLPQNHEEYRLIKVPNLPKRFGSAALSEDSSEPPADDVVSAPILEKIVGEYNNDGKNYYYAMVESGVIYRFTAHSVKDKYPDLIKEYERELKDGTLSDFDPTSTKVNPKHRLKHHPKSSRQPQRATRSKSSRSSSAAYESEAAEAFVISSGSDDDVPARQSSRIAANNKGKKPIARKLRNLNRNNNAGPSSDFEDKADSGSDYTVSSDADTGKKRIPPIRIKRTRRPRQSVKGLGIIRPFTEAVDSEDETDEAVLLRHRQHCEACGEAPALDLLEKLRRRKGKGKSGGRHRKKDDGGESSEPEEDRLENLGGWIRCLRCCVVGHWGCLSASQRQEILVAAKQHENELAKAEKRAEGIEVDDHAVLVDKRKQVWLDEATEFICGQCSKGGRCIVCKEETAFHSVPVPDEGSSAAKPIDLDTPPPEKAGDSEAPKETGNSASVASPLGPVKPGEIRSRYVPLGAPQILFRCITCRRPAHWEHMPPRDPSDQHQNTVSQIAEAYVEPGPDQWKCHECLRLKYPAESILGWRPDPPGAVETLAPGQIPKPKDMLPREYLVKFKERGFKRVEWVPHMWMLAMHEGILRHFLKDGTKLHLLEDESEEFQERIGKAEQSNDKGKGKSSTGRALDVLPAFARSRSISAEDVKPKPEYDETPGPMLDAQLRIPNSWLRIDRVLDLRLRRPKPKKLGSKIVISTKKRKATRVNDSDEADEIDSESDSILFDEAEFVDGEEPPSNMTETVADLEARKGRMPDAEELLTRAVWVYFKFEDLQYDECVWDSPPKEGSLEWDSYKRAVSQYLFAQSVQVVKLTKKEEEKRDNRPHRDLSHWSGADLQPKLEDESLKLMPFQVQGVQWLYGNWWNLQPSILADDMGLGKTVQLACLIGKLVAEHVFPHLIVVPNSTIVNWIREFERWAPHVRVVRFNGEAKARQVIKKYELWNADGHQMYHALVTTYETLAGVEFHQVFRKPGRWETVVVDEGQRLKSDSSLLFRKLNELKTIHRILMTGTPLNNNIRELFNLMNFLDSKNWNNLDELEKEYDQENLTEELIAQLHERLRPYFLRRQKAEVLDLPVKHEVIVPVSLVPIQKDIVRAILESNIQSLGLLADKDQSRKGTAPKKSALHNALMEMRKCIQHPYLNQPDMERRGLSPEETHKQLIDASAKFRLLKIMLPQLKKRGHRVLLFSQFKIVLDIIEDFLNMEGYKLLRLDGDTKSSLRQKEIDEYNKPGSDYFIYILTTRAGGVGVNLWSADTVIVFDPDFNPHQDLQAIARAHRYGQKNRVIVFKFMGKNTAEEKIFMMGKKKLVLDHLIVQKLGDEDEVEDIQGILMFGAKALFENPGESASDIKYTEKDVEELIIRAETEKIEEKQSGEAGGMKFDFAQVWNRQGNDTEVGQDSQEVGADDDFWAEVIKRAEEEKQKKRAQVLMGRGARKRAIANYREGDVEESPERKPKEQGSKIKEDNEFKPAGEESSSESEAGHDQMPSSDDYPYLLPGNDNPLVPFNGNLSMTDGYPPAVDQPVLLGPTQGPPTNPGSTHIIQPPKARKQRKPKQPLPGTHVAGQPSGVSGAPRPAVPRGIPTDGLYFCPRCHSRHGTGGCPASGVIDKLLQTHREILGPDNEDEPDHKYWALNHIEKKLKDEGFDLSQITKLELNPLWPPKAKTPPKPVPDSKPKPKKPKPSLPQVIRDQAGNVMGPSTMPGKSNANAPKKHKPPPAPGSNLGPASTVNHPGHSAFGTLSGPLMQPYNTPVAFNYGYAPAPAPTPFAKSRPAATFASSTADALNAAARTNLGHTPGHSVAPRPQAGPPPAHPTANSSNRTVSLANPSSQPHPAPRDVPHVIPGSSHLPMPSKTVQQPSVPAPSAASVSAAKRPANSPPEETRKKQKYSACTICGQKPGHPAHECPDIKTYEGLQNAVKKLEGAGPDVAPVLAVLRRMMSRRANQST